MAAAVLPSNLEGSSAGLLLLGALSIHQKDGKWTSIEKKAFIRSSIVGLLDRPLTTPPRAELLSTNKRTLRLCNSCFHCHLASTIVRSSIWQIKCSPTRSFHKTRTTSLVPLNSSSRTAPMPAMLFSHEPSVKISTVIVLMPKGIVRGWTLSSKITTSSPLRTNFSSGEIWNLLCPPMRISLKKTYLSARPAKYPVAKFNKP